MNVAESSNASFGQVTQCLGFEFFLNPIKLLSDAMREYYTK